jgi:hypothetical protein
MWEHAHMTNLFDRHTQNCFDGILFYKVIDGSWEREGVSGAAISGS